MIRVDGLWSEQQLAVRACSPSGRLQTLKAMSAWPVMSTSRASPAARQRPGRPPSAPRPLRRARCGGGAQSNAGMRVLIVGTENILDNLYYGLLPRASLTLPYP